MDLHSIAIVVLIAGGAPIVWRTLRGALRGEFAADLVASFAIIAAIALRQPVAGLVIVVMQTGGEFLERYAAGRASRALKDLEDASPHTAHRVRDDHVQDIAVDDVRQGDTLLVRPAELVPVDAVVVSGSSWMDTSRLTGEALPVEVAPGSALMSASINGDRPLTIRATARATESQYARIVQLVRSAQASKAPLQRIADRYAVWFTPLTLLVCVVAFALTHDWTRVLAVLVVATPCPLILAAPVAIVGGISHAARHGIIVRHGGALEAVAAVNTAVFDKTGTLTVGIPSVSGITSVCPFDKGTVLHLAAALEQGSGHLLARSIVRAAQASGNRLLPAQRITEISGRGVEGEVQGRHVLVGSRALVLERTTIDAADLAPLEAGDAMLRAFVAVDNALAGAIEFADEIRPTVRDTLGAIRTQGVANTLLLSGDNPAYVHRVAAELGISQAQGNLLPQDKLAIIENLEARGNHVLMVGDGVNDAPALSRASVGVALAAHGRGIASESADIVLLKDDIAGVVEAIAIGTKTMRVARQSIVVGLGLSLVAMGFAAAGAITPVVGALIQEGIDVAVILNALRTSR